MRRQINFRFLAILIVCTLALGVGIHFLHGFQFKRNAGILLEQAQRAEADQNWTEAAMFYDRYLHFELNTEVLAKLGQSLVEQGLANNNSRVLLRGYSVLEQALRRDPTQNELRERCISLAMEKLGFWDSARDHLLTAYKDSPDDAAIEFKIGRCFEAQRKNEEASDWYEKARKHNPGEVSYYVPLARVYQQSLQSPDKARQVLDDMVQKNPNSYKARFERAQFRILVGDKNKESWQAIKADIEEARRLGPSEADVDLLAAAFAQAQGERNEARAILEKGIKSHPKFAPFYSSLSQLELQEKRFDQALKVLRKGREAVPDDNTLTYLLAEILLERNDTNAAKAQVEPLKTSNFSRLLLTYLEARIELAEQKWSAAARKLELLRPDLKAAKATRALGSIDASRMLASVDNLLGICYARLGNPDQELSVNQEAVVSNPSSTTARFKLAQTYLELDRLQEAIGQFRQILTLPMEAKEASEVELALARTLIQQNVRLPEKKRNWTPVKESLARAAARLPDSSAIVVLRSQVLMLENRARAQDAQALVEKTLAAHPDDVDLWLSKASFAFIEGAAQALAVLESAYKNPKLRSRSELLTAKIYYTSRLPKAEAINALRGLEKEAQAINNDQVYSALAAAHLNLRETKDAIRFWTKVAQNQPNNLAIRLLLYDLTNAQGRPNEAEKWLEEIAAIEQPAGGKENQGTYTNYAIASRLVKEATPTNAEESLSDEARRKLEAARKHLTVVEKNRPAWHKAKSLMGVVDTLEKKNERAIENLQAAVDLGEREPVVIKMLVDLLISEKRFADADRIVEKLAGQDRILVAAGLGPMATIALLKDQKKGEALEMALRSVSPQSKNYKDHLWLARVLRIADKTDEARKELEKACQLAPKEPGPWEAYFDFLLGQKRFKEAQDVLQTIKTKVPEDKQALALAHCYIRLGKKDVAETLYRAALARKPKDVLIKVDLIGFLLQSGHSNKAKTELEILLNKNNKWEMSPEQTSWARRSLAIVLAGKSNYNDFTKALEELEKNLDANPNSLVDKRAKALVLSTRATRQRDAAKILEEVSQLQPLSPKEQFLLARIYARESDNAKFERQMLVLLGSEDGKNVNYIAYYARRLISENRLPEARTWLGKLEKLAPESFLAREIKARILKQEGKDADVEKVLVDFAKKGEPNMVQACVLLDEFSRTDKSETYRKIADGLYRQLADSYPKRENLLLRAQFLGYHKQTEEAIACCEKALQKGPPEAVVPAAVAALRANPSSKAHYSRVEKWIVDALRKKPKHEVLLVSLADFRDLQENYSAAIDIYQRLLKDNPENLVALNNLAWLLSFQDHSAEGLDLINRAIKIIGPEAELLDTKGVILIRAEDAANALEPLQQAIVLNARNTYYFHLALAFSKMSERERAKNELDRAKENLDRAKDAFTTARRWGMTVERLHPLERQSYRDLERLLFNEKTAGR